MGIILNLHEVHDPFWLENILCFLKKNYNPVRQTELTSLCKNGNEKKPICHITVDDGDKSFYKAIFPVLKKHMIPATIFVSPDLVINQRDFWFQEINGYEKQKLLRILSDVIDIDENNLNKFPLVDIFKCLTINLIWEVIDRYKMKYQPRKKPCHSMDVNELKEIDNSGLVTVGAHTLRHPILANEELTVSKNEIISSFTGLADILGHKIECFAYPNGMPVLDFGQREMDILKDYGCSYSFSTESGNFNSRSNLLSIPRYGLNCGESRLYFKNKLFFGAQWNKIMKLKPGNESRNRKAILRIIKK
ncbi:MAG: polysaccharide deacetylase family protein [Bacteroidales bacterium]|nr:polysaccharide deacetylase family protein [Bacteroidales bacterium]